MASTSFIKQIVLTSCLLASVTMLHAQKHKPPVDYLGSNNAISFQKKTYQLAWSSHPTANYYKQEYVPKGDSVARFKTMVMLEAVTGMANLKDAVAAKVEELKAMKEKNPIVQYETFSNAKTGEYMIDFLLSANAPDGSISVIERNVYRYKTFADKKGATGILLLALSERSYDDATSFLQKLKKEKAAMVNAVATMAWPGAKL